MDRDERCAKFRSINLLFGLPSLIARLRLSHAFLDSFDAISTGKCAPPADPEALQDGVRIDEDGASVARHGPLTNRTGVQPRAPRTGRPDRQRSGRAGPPPAAPKRGPR